MIFVQVSIYLSRYLEKRLRELNPLKGYQDTLACSPVVLIFNLMHE